MVKLYCDKCGKEIKDKYYTININEHDKYSTNKISTDDCIATAYSARDDALKMLNSQKMYCKNCKDKVESFLWENYDNTDNCSFL